jgi:regulator of RNase E activity RraB
MRSLQLGLIPDDENGEVLKRMVEDGDDLTLARPVEFFHVFADEEQANAFASAAAQLPSVAVEAPEVDEEDEVEVWQVCVIRVMAPSHAAITALESELGALAETHGGFADGWGCSPAERPH